MQHEWVILANLFLLLMGFALLSRHFEKSQRARRDAGASCPTTGRARFVLLVIVVVISSFLDNIAAALIGGAMARAGVPRQGAHRLSGRHRRRLQRRRLRQRGRRHHHHHDVDRRRQPARACSRPSSRPSVALVDLRHPGRAAAAALFADHEGRAAPACASNGRASASCAPILVAAILANVIANLQFPAAARHASRSSALAVWVVILRDRAAARGRTGRCMPETFKGTIFLLALVTCASMMPVEKLPAASWQTALGLGFVSAVFDNIPLTALALKQGGYDWGFLAYAVGFGGSMIWFGSSAGVALANMYPEAKSVGLWLRHGWHVTVAYVDRLLRHAGRARLASRPAAPQERRADHARDRQNSLRIGEIGSSVSSRNSGTRCKRRPQEIAEEARHADAALLGDRIDHEVRRVADIGERAHVDRAHRDRRERAGERAHQRLRHRRRRARKTRGRSAHCRGTPRAVR